MVKTFLQDVQCSLRFLLTGLTPILGMLSTKGILSPLETGVLTTNLASRLDKADKGSIKEILPSLANLTNQDLKQVLDQFGSDL